MTISHLEHFLVVAQDYEATVHWYVENLGFEKGPHPDFGPDVEVTWLYLGDRDVIHVVPPRPDDEVRPAADPNATPEDIAQGSRPIHHIAFRAADREEGGRANGACWHFMACSGGRRSCHSGSLFFHFFEVSEAAHASGGLDFRSGWSVRLQCDNFFQNPSLVKPIQATFTFSLFHPFFWGGV